jgi:hypothetical protein
MAFSLLLLLTNGCLGIQYVLCEYREHRGGHDQVSRSVHAPMRGNLLREVWDRVSSLPEKWFADTPLTPFQPWAGSMQTCMASATTRG